MDQHELPADLSAPFVSLSCLLVLFQFLSQIGFQKISSLLSILVVTGCSPFLWYGSSPHETSQIFLFLILSGVMVTARPDSESFSRLSFSAGFIATVVTWFKPLLAIDVTFLLLAFCILLKNQNPDNSQSRFKLLWLGYFVGGLFSLSLFLYDNFNRFGDPLRTPYSVWFEQHGLDPFALPFWKGLFGQTLSLDFGLLWICPVVFFILVPVLLKRVDCKYFWPVVLIWSSWLISVLVHSSYVSYAGSHAFGPRFQMHLIPFLFLPLPLLIEGKLFNKTVIGFLIFGFLMSASAKIYAPGLEITRNEGRFENVHFIEEASFSQGGLYVDRIQSIGLAMTGSLDDSLPSSNDSDLNTYYRSLTKPDYWFIRSFNVSKSVGLFTLLITLIQLVVLAGSLWWVRRKGTNQTY